MLCLTIYFEFGPEATFEFKFEIYRVFRRHLNFDHQDNLEAFIVKNTTDTDIEIDINKLRDLGELFGDKYIKSIKYKVSNSTLDPLSRFSDIIKEETIKF